MDIDKIEIVKNLNMEDSYAKTGKVMSIDDLEYSIMLHKNDVRKIMKMIAFLIIEAGENHDWTKIATKELLYEDNLNTIITEEPFKELGWWKFHVNAERHHLNDRVPDDVNLIDIIEYISDCVAAGKARHDELYPITISSKTLEKAFYNTVKLIENNTKSVDK